MKRTTAWCAAAGAILASFAPAQEKPQLPVGARNSETRSTFTQAGDGVFRPDPAGLVFAPLPADMPPLSEIPPMPMPAGGPVGVVPQHAGTVLFYDPNTGETREEAASMVRYDEGQGGGFQGNYPIGEDSDGMSNWNSTMSTVANSTLLNWPARGNCKLAMRFVRTNGTSGWFVCSGSMIDAQTVVTAAHCVYLRDTAGFNNQWAVEIYVFPGWTGTGDPTPDSIPVSVYNQWGFARMTGVGAGSAYVNSGDLQADVGFVGVDRAVGMLTGWYGWNYGSSCSTIQSRTYHNYSYPAENCGGGLHTGAQMYYWFGDIDDCPDNRLRIATNSGCTGAVWGGMSGSSMYYIDGSNRYISAVCSTSNRSTQAHYCRLWEGIVNFMNDTMIPGDRGSSLDLQALDCNLSNTNINAMTAVSGFNFLMSNPTNNNPPSRTYTLRVRLSTDLDISSSDTDLGQHTIIWDFAAMDNLRVNLDPFFIPLSVPPGTYYMGVILDTGTGGDVNSSNNDTDTWDAVQVSVGACNGSPVPTSVLSTDYAFCDRVRLTWNTMPSATSYTIWRSTTNNSATAVQIATDNASPYDDTSAASNVFYYYWVRAVYPCGTSGFSAVAGGIRNSTPAAPTGVNATDSTICNSVTVTWTAAARATNYFVYRNTTNSSAGSTLLGSTASTSFADASGVGGIVYYYFVRASNDCGTSGYSASNAGSEQYSPAAPTGVAASDGTACNGVVVTWNSVLNADTYNLYRNTVNNSGTSSLVTSGIAGTSTTDTTAVANTTYFYWVRSNNVCGLSGYSASNSGFRASTLGAPTGVTASDGPFCTPGITVSWNAVAGANSYGVRRSTSNNILTSSLVATIGAPVVTYTDNTAAVGTTYYYWVFANNLCGGGAFSASDSGNRGGTPLAPVGVNATDGTRCNSVSISWAASTGATSYQIFRNTVNNSGTSVQIGNSAASPFVDNTVVGSTTYFYWVRAFSPCGTSGFSSSNSGFGGTSVGFDQHPADVTVFEGQDASFSVVIGGATAYQWLRNGLTISNGPKYDGTNTPNLTIFACEQSDEANYSCFVRTPCGNVTSNNGLLTVDELPCPADFNQDGGIDGSDVQAFYDAWESGFAEADVNFDGGVDGNDVDYFFERWEAGGCF